MVSMPRKPSNWGDDFNDLEVNRNPSVEAPATVTDGAALMRPAPDLGAGHDAAYLGPDPAYYAKLGETARKLISNPDDAEGFSAAGGLLYDAANLARFKRGHSLDAESYGASQAYGNYAFGVYNAARGAGLPDALDLANTYGKHFSHYDPKNIKMDKTYPSIPADNVQNITRGYNDYQNGTLRRLP